MKIKLDTPITTFDGQTVHHQDGKPATVRSIIAESLVMGLPSDPRDGGAFQYRCYQLGHRIATCEPDLSVEELALIKQRVGNQPAYNHLVIGRVFDAIERSNLDLHVAKE